MKERVLQTKLIREGGRGEEGRRGGQEGRGRRRRRGGEGVRGRGERGEGRRKHTQNNIVVRR